MMDSPMVSRRTFVGTAATAALAATLPRKSIAANDRIQVASIGLNGIGSMHLGQLKKMDEVEVVAICDVDDSVLDRASKTAGEGAERYKDFRELLERDDIDAVFIAVPDHWHAYIAIAAIKAGKDVYVEKPLAHNIREGRLVIEAARKHNRVVQVGLQQHSSPHWIHAVERIQKGDLGKISMVHAWNAWNKEEMRGDLDHPPDGDPPKGVDYDMWLGPAPERPFNPVRFHRSWYFFWDYGGGMMSGWGVHLFDIVLWAMGHDFEQVSAAGGKFVFDDIRETPDTSEAVFDSPTYTLTYSCRHGSGWRPHGNMDHGIEFFGTEAILQINRRGYHIIRESDRDTREPIHSEARDRSIDGHLTSYWHHKKNFFECIRTREPPHADVEIGHLASIPGHLANIAHRVGRCIRWDWEKETIPGDDEARRLLGREYRDPWVL